MALAPSSPRLPSPPPTAEIQIGPKSPAMNSTDGQQAQERERTAFDTNARRRVHPGTRSSEMAAGPPLIALNELDSAFQLQEHLAALHYDHTAQNTQPMTRETSQTLAQPPAGIDKTLWLYELCRFLIGQCNGLIVGFLFDTPPCSAATCPEMRASEWQFLCAVHESPKSCCAIDYCCHTLDWAANVVTNPKLFPSRFVAPAADGGTGGASGTTGAAHDRASGGAAAHRNLVNVFRRLHRIFAHAWFQHRGVFWSVEAQTGLYVFFKTVCDFYDLLPAENYKLPPEAEGLEPATGNGTTADAADEKQRAQPPPAGAAGRPTSILRAGQQDGPQSLRPDGAAGDDETSIQPASRTATRRHVRANPSTGSAVTTVIEADETDDTGAAAAVASKLKDMHISVPPATVQEEDDGEEEGETADVPVIVMHSGLDNVTPQAMKPDEALLPALLERHPPSGGVGKAAAAAAAALPSLQPLAKRGEGGDESAAMKAMPSPSEPKTAIPDDDDEDKPADDSTAVSATRKAMKGAPFAEPDGPPVDKPDAAGEKEAEEPTLDPVPAAADEPEGKTASETEGEEQQQEQQQEQQPPASEV